MQLFIGAAQGNTEAMANFVASGAKEAGAEVSIFTASEFGADMMNTFDAVAFGCPSMGAEQLEESEFEPMFTACEANLQGKKELRCLALMAGEMGEWMRVWEETCQGDGAVFVSKA